ncbi:MAG: acyl-CoA dehydratase activase-related protein [Alistipes sp.]
MKHNRIGLDVGSTTLKVVVLDDHDNICFSTYVRHNARIRETLSVVFSELGERFGDELFSLTITGSVGLGIAERTQIPFVQEVVASTAYVRRYHPQATTLIDIGGEDAKVVFLKGETPDMRMNSNCAGGTGAFIDQMALLLDTTPAGLDRLAQRAVRIHPIASRCGVFAKTDIQNLLAKNVSREEIAASIFHAVAVQTVVTLSHGCDIEAPVLFCGGPLAFLPSLRKAFAEYLHLDGTQTICPADAQLLPAWGTALSGTDASLRAADEWLAVIAANTTRGDRTYKALPAIFENEEAHTAWRRQRNTGTFRSVPIPPGRIGITLGIDSGSTTTKIAAFDDRQQLLFTHYAPNNGNPIAAVGQGLRELLAACRTAGADPVVEGSCVTGYGEDLIKAAFGLDAGVIETIAHYLAAKEITPDVSFILDIGGQDMKAIFVEHGAVTRMEINEACSSGCGSFIETFARSLGSGVGEFAAQACTASHPCDLGTRCTVFMNSRVKQMLREGASMADIAAGLSYSVVKNCLYKVLKLRSADEMGGRIVVQGGTMRNDAVVRAFERLTGREVFRSDRPEMMGAFGCALYAGRLRSSGVSLEQLLETASCTSDMLQCRGCENRCMVTRYRFSGGNTYYSGNKCERHFSNKGSCDVQGENAYAEKLRLLFDRSGFREGCPVVGIPRCLNTYEEYPFWHTLLSDCGISVVLSDPSNMRTYEHNVRRVMSDNICFPAKLVHAHISDLVEKGVDRILMPYVVYEQPDGKEINSYSCPIVAGYSDVVRSVDNLRSRSTRRPFRSVTKATLPPVLRLSRFAGVARRKIRTAFRRALDEQRAFARQLRELNGGILRRSRDAGRLTLLVAGRPYHADPLIQHKIAEMVAGMGVDVITDDIVRGENISTADTHYVAQWAYANRILRAAAWASRQDRNVQFVELTSFGCGPDALLTDEVRDLLGRHGKSLTLLKIDDVSNTGSLKLRIRSLIESLKLGHASQAAPRPFVTTPDFGERDRKRKILVPFFTPFISPLIPALLKRAGYEAENLPMSTQASVKSGLRYANNEICYPATLIVGDIVNALQSGRHDPTETAVAITQTGGQCRASNYIALIRKGLVNAGFADVPVISVSPGSGLQTTQPGFRIPWLRVFRGAIGAVLFTDCLARLYYARPCAKPSPAKRPRCATGIWKTRK